MRLASKVKIVNVARIAKVRLEVKIGFRVDFRVR